MDGGSLWILDCIVFFCKYMGLTIKGREMELLSFLTSLEVNRKKGDQVVADNGGVQVGERTLVDGPNI